MDTDNLKYVVGKVNKDAPAIIRFFGEVTRETTKNFNDEFLWLQNSIQPSKIIVLINSDGGSVMYGMTTFSIIQSCPIEVDCVIEGIAASMGGVIWSAGKNLYMHDYSILMIHNPFGYELNNSNESVRNMVNAFRGQLETIYHKRFGLTKEKVRAIMNGEGEADGTYFNAREVVAAGILPASNILKTSKQVCDKVKNQIEGITSMASIRDIMASITKDCDENKLLEEVAAIHKQNENEFQEQKKVMNENERIPFGAVAAQLGFSNDVPVTSVSARITELLRSESDLQDVKSQLSELQIQYKGKETEVSNLNEKLSEVEGALKVYQDAEKAAKDAEIANMVQAAIDEGKIKADDRADWIEMAKTNFGLAKSTLDSISGRDKISAKIANDPDNINRIQEEVKTVEEKMTEKVKAVIGDIKLKKF